MRFKIFCFAILSSVTCAYAQLNGDGYYRVKNYYTSRYIYVMDDKGSVNIQTTDADMNAIVLSKETGRETYDPAGVIYIKGVGSDNYNLAAMGTSVHDIIGYYLTIRQQQTLDGLPTYFCMASASGITKILCDVRKDDSYTESKPGTNARSGTIRNWLILPITNTDDAYIGIKPDVQIGDKYYKAYYVSYPFKLASSGMKVYYVNNVTSNGVAVKKEIAEGTIIPPATPVVIECSSSEPTNNRIDILDQNATAISDNVLKGNYFYYNDDWYKNHYNRTPNDQSTMRLLGVMSNGEIGFVKSSLEYLPQNCAYLTVPVGSADEIPLLDESAGISYVTVDNASSSTAVYTLQGVKVADSLNTSSLPKGIYIVGGKKVMVK